MGKQTNSPATGGVARNSKEVISWLQTGGVRLNEEKNEGGEEESEAGQATPLQLPNQNHRN